MVGALTGLNLVPLSLGGDNMNGGENSRPTDSEGVMWVGYVDGGGGILHIAELSKCVECMT